MAVIGTVEAYSTVTVRAQITGELTTVKFQQGDDVESGQELFTLEMRRPLEAALMQAEANLQRDTAQAGNARAIAERYEQLVERGISPRTARHRTGHGGRARGDARRRSSRRRERQGAAPVRHHPRADSGTDRRPDGSLPATWSRQRPDAAGHHQPGVADLRVVRLPRGVAVGALRRYLDRGSLRVEARPTGSEAPAAVGSITFVDNAVDQTTGTIKIKGTFSNENRSLWPGQFVNVVVRLATESAAIVVPTVAVQTGPRAATSTSSSRTRPWRCVPSPFRAWPAPSR